jgi:UDP-3-O-[3-hydroxymyristoyl] glucosamine N-acyltransferase
MSANQFFEKKGPFPLSDIAKVINCDTDLSKEKNFNVHSLESLDKAGSNDMTFLNSTKYNKISKNTLAGACITSKNFFNLLPKECIKLDVKNILSAVTQVTKLFFPKADIDALDQSLSSAESLISKYPKVLFGKNVLIGKNVKIGKKTQVSSNTIIESNVNIGENCLIGAFVVIRNSFIANNVYIQDGSKIGLKGFGFIPKSGSNLRTPHIGKVILENGVEVGANSTIDRGSISNTVIGENTFLDNQVHVAHNVQIGKNCMIAGQVGFAGSSIIGDNVVIGGQAGVSGHLKIGNNVKIGGGSGVVNNIADNQRVMGYPAISLKDFAKLRKK